MRRTASVAAWLTAAALAAVTVLVLAVVWEPFTGGASILGQASHTQVSPQAQAAELHQAAEQLSGALRNGLACAIRATALLEAASATGASWSTASNALDYIRVPLQTCIDQGMGIEQAFVVTSPGAATQAAALRADREPSLGPIDERYLGALQVTVAASAGAPSGRCVLAPGASDSLDQLVPVRGAGLSTLLVLRYSLRRAVQDQLLPTTVLRYPMALADDRSRLDGVPIAGSGHLRLVMAAQFAAQALRPWVLSALAIALLLLGSAGLYGALRGQRQHHAALQAQITQLQARSSSLQMQAAAHAEAERQLTAQAAWLHDIEDAVNVGLRVLDKAGRLTAVNRAFCELSGWSRSQLLEASPPYPFWPADELATHLEYLASVVSGPLPAERYQVNFVRPDGERWTAEVRASPLAHDNGWILACTDITQDIENQARTAALYENIRQQADLHLLAEWAGEFLHKMSNHAGACVNACDGMRKFLANGRLDMLAEGAELASRAANDMHAVIERFRPRLRAEPAYDDAQLWDVVADALAQQSGLAASRNIQLVNIVSTDLPAQRVDRQALLEVLINLINNGILAMADTPLSNRMLILESVIDEERAMVELHVRDRGCGIAPDLRHKVFAQGYTTRERGTGWGLFMSRQWVERMGGKLEIASSGRSGTDMVVALPLNPEPVASAHG